MIVAHARAPKQANARAILSPFPAAVGLFPPISGSGRLDAVQTVRSVLAGEEHDIAIRRGLAGMHRIGGDVDHRTGLGLDLLVADLRPERTLQDIDPLLVRVRMRFRAGAGGHAHQADDHAIAFDAGAVGGRIVGAAEDVVHLGEIEQVFTVARARGARCPGGFLRHRFLLRRTHYYWCVIISIIGASLSVRQADARAVVLLPAAPSSALARPPRMEAWSPAGMGRPRTWSTPSGMPMSKG